MYNIRKLKPEEIECRISQCFENKCTALLYKTARVDRAILDEVFGAMNWQNDFKLIDGKMYGGIAVCYDNNGQREWVWKWDCGTESNTEAEKGQASDCFKRAGFKWGIGIELYSAPQIWLNIPTKKNDKGKWEPVNKYNKYDVVDVGYDECGNINKLSIQDKKGEILFTYATEKLLGQSQKQKPKNQPLVNEDFDLIEELRNKKDIPNLLKFFNENQKNAKDKAAFMKEFRTVKATLEKGA